MELLIKQKRKGKKKKERKIEITIRKVVLKLFEVMKSHIGSGKSIERSALFSKVFDVDENDLNELQLIALWDILKRAMHRCRQRTKCFITNMPIHRTRYYFVVKTYDDAMMYSRIAQNTIKRIKNMEARAFKSAEESWYKEDWEY